MERKGGQKLGNNFRADIEPRAAGLEMEQGSGGAESEQDDLLNGPIERVIYSVRDRTIRETHGLLDGRLKKTLSI